MNDKPMKILDAAADLRRMASIETSALYSQRKAMIEAAELLEEWYVELRVAQGVKPEAIE